MNRFAELKTLLISLEDEFNKLYEKNNKAAGTRIRKGMQELKKIAQEIRVNVSEYKSSPENSKAAPPISKVAS